jgi:protein-disulfide isomerase
MNNCVPRWRGSAPRSSEIEPVAATCHRNPPLPQLSFQASEGLTRQGFFFRNIGRERAIRGPLMITRRAFTAALSLTGLGLLAGFSPLRLISEAMFSEAMAQGAADVAKPQSLPDMGLGPANAAVTITEYASMTCPHCAAFTENVFPKIKSEFIDTGKIRFVFREFPLDIKAAAGSMLARCIAKDDAGKYFAVIDLLFKQQNEWVVKNTTETLTRIGKQAGLTQQAVEDCLKDQALLDKIAADQKFAAEVLKVNSTPTFFINGEMLKGETSFEEFSKRINAQLKS